MDDTSLEAWALFLEGRLAQERGEHAAALAAFDRLAKANLDSPVFANGHVLALKAATRASLRQAVEIGAWPNIVPPTPIEEQDNSKRAVTERIARSPAEG